MEDPSAYDQILDTLVILRRLLKSSEDCFQYYQPHYLKIHEIITKALSHEYSKVVSESLRVAGVFVNILRDHNSGLI